jgi:type I restriction enzyme S subunit
LGIADLEREGAVQLGRGKVISKKDLAATPGSYPVYSSAKENDGKFGEYGLYMFDEELITWSVDGGGRLFHRPRHRFSITNVGGFIRILQPERIYCRYLYFALSYLHSQVVFDWVHKAHPSVIRNVYTAIPLPTLKEQKRIVAVLDQAFAALDRARAHAEANLADAQELFVRQRETLLSGNKKRWPAMTVSDVCERFEYGTSTKSLPEGRVPVLRMGNLQHGELDWSSLVYTDDSGDIQKLALHADDVLFNRTNSAEHVGKTAIFRGEREAIFAGYLIRLHVRKNIINPEYLNIFLNSNAARDYGRTVMGKSVNQANISASKLRTYPIDVPSLAEQEAIVENLLCIREQTSKLKDAFETKLADLADLRQSLLQKAFSGELI